MTEKEYFESGLSYYGGVIDKYLFEESTTLHESNDDPLLTHITALITDALSRDYQSPLWKHTFRKELMIYLEEVLSLCFPIVKEFYRQKAMIEHFRQLSVQDKMQMWELVYATIRNYYSNNELDVDTFSRLVLEADRIEDLIAIWNVLENNWYRENIKKKNSEIERLLEKTKSGITTHSHHYGQKDYRVVKEINDISRQYPILKEIAQVLGRNRHSSLKEDNPLIQKFQPGFVSNHAKNHEVETICLGDNLCNVVASELSFLSDTGLEELFYYKYATKRLMLFSNKQQASTTTSNSSHMSTKHNMGPIIVCIDTSGSMVGLAEKIAKCTLLHLLDMAKSKGRKCYLISFSVRAQAIDLGNPNNWRILNQFINNRFTGGTNAEEMLSIALEMLKQKEYSLADVLIISDFIFPQPSPTTIRAINIAHKSGTHLYGLKIGNHNSSSELFLMKIWRISGNSI